MNFLPIKILFLQQAFKIDPETNRNAPLRAHLDPFPLQLGAGVRSLVLRLGGNPIFFESITLPDGTLRITKHLRSCLI